MSKIIVKELAKEINKKSKEIVDFLREKGYSVTNMNSSLDAAEERIVREQFAPETIKKEKAAPKTEAKPKRAKAPAQAKPMKQTFDGRSPEVIARAEREAAKRESKKAVAAKAEENKSANKETEQREIKNSDELKDIKESKASKEVKPSETKTENKEETVSTTVEKNKKEETAMTPEEAARAYAEKKARQAAAAKSDRQPKSAPANTGRSRNGDRNSAQRSDRPQGGRDGQSGKDGGFRGSRNTGAGKSDRPQTGGKGERQTFGSRNSDGDKGFQGRQGGGSRPQSGGKAVGGRGQSSSGGEERLVTKTSSNRDRDRERERAKERERNEKNLGKRFDKNKALTNLDDEGNAVHRKKKDPNRKGAFIKPEVVVKPAEEETIKNITLPETLTIKELADKMKMQPSIIIKKLFLQGKMYTVTQDISFEEAEEIALDYDVMCEKEEQVDLVAELLKEEEEDEALMDRRPPVVCVMGHVDHGKTSLLDAIRSTNVTSREAGGITQSIGASVVEINGKKITFLDTPGHEAFTAMRMRGAKSTDIAILVVAADDGVMPQTVEAINHAKAAGIEIIVAINKIDKPSANIEKVKQELTEYELIPEDWGGSTIFAPVSAHSKEGIPQLLEMVLLVADVAEYKANPNRDARGIVIEASLDKGRGSVATVLVQKGTLKVGDNISIGSSFGKVRAMIDDKGKNVQSAGPSIPVEILGLNGVPNSGDTMLCFKDEKEARAASGTYIAQDKARLIDESRRKLSLDGLFDQIKAGNIKEFKVIIKADVQGSVEAIKQSLEKLNNEEVAIRVIHGAVGTINESDVSLASASNAIIIGFNVRMDAVAKDTAEREKVDVRLYKVIYSIISDIESAMKGMLEPIYEAKVIGHAEVRQVFKASGIGNIAGSYVLDGKIIRGCKAKITRDGEQIFDGNLASLKRFKDDVKEVNAGYECGLVFEKFNDVKEEDKVELYQMVEVPRS